MAVPTVITDLSVTAASNSPAGADSIGTSLDDHIRALAAITRRLQAKGADVASAGTVDLGAITDGNIVHITGTTTITAFGTVAAGISRTLVFDGALTLTHNATSLILLGGANITTAAGDIAEFVSEGSGNWRMVRFFRKSALPALAGALASSGITGAAASGANADITSMSAITRTPWSPAQNDFRLTLTSGTPVTTSDVTGATTIYCTPYKGKSIALYDGANWNIRQSAEFSLALGTLTSGTPYDVFCYDNSGTPTLEFLAWTNDTTRATALTYQDGVLVKTGAVTRRYLGTFYTTSTTQTEDSVSKRYLWNYYHRARRPMWVFEATNSWAYTLATLRQANGSTANQLSFVIGVAEDAVRATVSAVASNTGTGVNFWTAIGLDSTANKATNSLSHKAASYVANAEAAMTAHYNDNPGVGRHFLAWLERSSASGTTTWIGDDGGALTQSGIIGEVLG